MMAAEKMEERHLETANLVSCCGELAAVLDSGEPVFKEVKKLSDITSNVVDKINKTKDAVIHTTQSLTDHIAQIEGNKFELQQELQECITDNEDVNVIPSINLKIADLKQRARCKEKDCNELQTEHKRVKNNNKSAEACHSQALYTRIVKTST